MQESIVCCSTCTTSSYRKFTFAVSSFDEFLVTFMRIFIHQADMVDSNKQYKPNEIKQLVTVQTKNARSSLQI